MQPESRLLPACALLPLRGVSGRFGFRRTTTACGDAASVLGCTATLQGRVACVVACVVACGACVADGGVGAAFSMASSYDSCRPKPMGVIDAVESTVWVEPGHAQKQRIKGQRESFAKGHAL